MFYWSWQEIPICEKKNFIKQYNDYNARYYTYKLTKWARKLSKANQEVDGHGHEK